MTDPDLLIIGSGLSGASLIQELTRRVPDPPPGRQIRILAVEKRGEFGGGIAYGKAMPLEFVLNDQLRIMGTDDFASWLVRTRSRWLTELENHRSPATAQWLRNHHSEISACDFSNLHIPRRVFGDFVRAGLGQAIESAPRSGFNVELKKDEVTEITPESDGFFRVRLKNSGLVRASLVALASGASPRLLNTELSKFDGYIDDFYSEDLSDLTEGLEDLLARESEQNRRMVIIGGNATAAEFIFFLRFSGLASLVSEVIVATPRGALPPAAEGSTLPPYDPSHLRNVSWMRNPTANDLYRALEFEHKNGASLGYTVLDIVDYTLLDFRKGLNALPNDEQLRWVNDYGHKQQDLVLRVPSEYSIAADWLRREGKLVLERGKVTDIVPTGRSFLVRMEFDDGRSKTRQSPVVVDCTGFGTISATSSPLLRQLRAGPAFSLPVNVRDKGFKLNSTFEAYPNLFVLGPLMTGFSNQDTHIWHLQNIPRIGDLARRVASLISSRFSTCLR